ncbi:hypothetical protein GCM10010172_24400 [Paractinoplanes ferrugineus]|uniref:Uncharacterized protein n=1 Tax=Paractinoplanes ferrugineus TaxID=113564 RepID=A0A919IXT8_9ACTN|nr:hypothetical protein [Actinoplanes ferrugineus]GIE08649.1 hypothetical protein Afe05nite_04890 [Actinoplanes ferrugineus]
MLVDEKSSRWAAAGRLARWIMGALSLVGGLTWILAASHGPTDLAVGLVLAAAGLVLLMPHRIELPRRLTALVVAGFAVVGTVAGLVVLTERVGSFAYVADRGWPFMWVQRYAVADDAATARSLAASASWTVDMISLSVNLLVWAYAGMLLVVIGVLMRRNRDGQRPDSAR